MSDAGWIGSMAALALGAAVLVVAGVRFTRIVDRLADATGLGEAVAGAVLLGATTSAPGLVVTVVAAAQGDAELAVSNAVGGIAAQTAFLALADWIYRRANLEHAAASLPNLLQSVVLVALIAVVMAAAAGPDLSLAGVHPASAALIVGYAYGLLLTRRVRADPMWHPRRTTQTRVDTPDHQSRAVSLRRLWCSFAIWGVAVVMCGFLVAHAGLELRDATGLSGTIVGGFVTAVITSLPELVTVIAAVRAGALTLAVGDIIGGNTFDVLFIAAGDAAFRDGPIYAAIGPSTLFLLATTALLTAVLAAGLIYRERTGIGFEGFAILAIYAVGLIGSVTSS